MRFFILFVILLASLTACQSRPANVLTINGLTMGTTYTVKIISENKLDQDMIHTGIEKFLAEINQSMSTYIADSELSRLNQSDNTDWQELSNDLFTVINHAHGVSVLSDGAFDMTIGPLVNLWGFGPEPLSQTVPTDESIESTRQYTGYQKIKLDKTNRRISKAEPNIYIDLSGIAKGFAVEKIANYLQSLLIENYMVEIGGEIMAMGLNEDNVPWQIGIEKPETSERSVQTIIGLNNIAMATSGDYRNYYEKDGIRYSHTIDPLTGKPITHSLAAVTVLHKSAMHADAMATAFMVLGPDKALALANKHAIAVYLISKTDTGFEQRYNKYFNPYLSE